MLAFVSAHIITAMRLKFFIRYFVLLSTYQHIFLFYFNIYNVMM